MAHVILLVNAAAKDKITLKWSDGAGWFDPYDLDKVPSRRLLSAADQAREGLRRMANIYLAWVDPNEQARREENKAELEQACAGLAHAGHAVYRELFQAGNPRRADAARSVEQWFQTLAAKGEIETLEVVVEDGSLAIPWTVVYEEKPDGRRFPVGEDPDMASWAPFWGLRYRLGIGRKADPLRRLSAPHPSVVLVVVDPVVYAGLQADEKQRLDGFLAKHNLERCETFERLQALMTAAASRPHVLYWLGHTDPTGGLQLGDRSVTPMQLYDLLQRDDADAGGLGFPGLAFVNACGTAVAAPQGADGDISFPDVIHERDLAGCIVTEAITVDVFANRLGLEFLEGCFLGAPPAPGKEDEGCVGHVLRQVRRVPLGLLYAAQCPPRLRRHGGDGQPGPRPAADPGAGGNALGVTSPGAAATPEPPELPYRSLDSYGERDAALFSGRDGDVMRFAQILDTAGTRLVLLHGESGAGKTSFLCAGVLPHLRGGCLGFAEPTLLVRSTGDPVGQVAAGLFAHCQQRVTRPRPAGQGPTEADLRPVVAAYRDAGELRAALLHDAGLLARLLAHLGDVLHGTAVLVIDQAEEIFTLERTLDPGAAVASRKAALEMLRHAGEAAGNFKVIIALRTEYYGRYVHGLRRGVREGRGVREYLLTDLDEHRLRKAITLPTEVAKYNFRFDEGVAEDLTRDIILFCRNRLDSVQPLAQAICAQLYERVSARADRTIRAADVRELGGVEGGIRLHVARLIDHELTDPRDRAALRELLTELFLVQPDGTLTTGMMPQEKGGAGESVAGKSVAGCWGGVMPVGELVERMSKPGVRLLRVSVLPQDGGREQRCVSLGHDAMASCAKEWREERERQERWARTRKKFLALAAGALVVLLLGLWVAWQEVTRRAEQQAQEDRMATATMQQEGLRANQLADGISTTALTEVLTKNGPHYAKKLLIIQILGQLVSARSDEAWERARANWQVLS